MHGIGLTYRPGVARLSLRNPVHGADMLNLWDIYLYLVTQLISCWFVGAIYMKIQTGVARHRFAEPSTRGGF